MLPQAHFLVCSVSDCSCHNGYFAAGLACLSSYLSQPCMWLVDFCWASMFSYSSWGHSRCWWSLMSWGWCLSWSTRWWVTDVEINVFSVQNPEPTWVDQNVAWCEFCFWISPSWFFSIIFYVSAIQIYRDAYLSFDLKKITYPPSPSPHNKERGALSWNHCLSVFPCVCAWLKRYLLNCSTFCNQTWYGGALSFFTPTSLYSVCVCVCVCVHLSHSYVWTLFANSKHWFTTSFQQPLPYLVTPQGPENCQLTSSFFLLVLKQ